MKVKKIIFKLIPEIILSLALAALIPVEAYCASPENLTEYYYVDNGNVQGISVDYISTGFNHRNWVFPYSDDYFKEDCHKYHQELAKASLGFAVSADRDGTLPLANQGDSVNKYLTDCGFTDVDSSSFTLPSDKDAHTCAIGHKQIDDFTLVAFVSCGAGYGKEWASNVKLGEGVRHQGFDETAKAIEADVDKYIKDHNITGKIKLWTTGFSRASALANVVAADYTEAGQYDVFCYTFASPRTTTEPIAYDTIYNILGKNDPVTKMPLASWGFYRYGIDKYLTAQEFNSDFAAVVYDAAEISNKLIGRGFFNNPDMDIDFIDLIGSLSEAIPTREVFRSIYEKTLVELINEGKITDISGFLHELTDEAYLQFGCSDQKDAEVLEVLIGIATKYYNGVPSQIEDRSWQPDMSLSGNMGHEHCEDVYLSLLYTDKLDEIFPEGTETMLMYISGDVDVEVYSGDYLCEIIDHDGNLLTANEISDEYIPYGYETEGAPVIHALRVNDMTTLALPMDGKYIFIMKSHKDQNINVQTEIYDVLKSRPGQTMAYNITGIKDGSSVVTPIMLRNGEMQLKSDDITKIETVGGDSEDKAFIVKLSAANLLHLRFSTVEMIMNIIVAFLAALILLSITVLIVRKRHGSKTRKKILFILMGLVQCLMILIDYIVFSFLKISNPICIVLLVLSAVPIIWMGVLLFLIIKKGR